MDIKIKNFVHKLSLKQRISIAIMCMVFIRIGTLIQIPFVNADYMKSLLGDSNMGVLSILTGNALTQMGIFALSISPYISASIIIQLLAIVFHPLEELAKDGKTGQEKYKKIIRFTGIGLAFIQSLAMAIGFGSSGLIDPYSAYTVCGAVAIWTIGAIVLIIIGEFLDTFELGSGISMILFVNIISTVPGDVKSIYDMFIHGKNIGTTCVTTIIAAGIALAVLAACNVLTSAERRITVLTSMKVGAGSNTTTMPIPFLTCSVMPVIFTSTILSIPVLLSRLIPSMQTGIPSHIVSACSQSNWFNTDKPFYSFGIIAYIGLNLLFTYFYLMIQYNPIEIADNLKKSGSVIPGIRAGKPTADYLTKVTRQTAIAGSMCLVALILATTCLMNLCNIGNMALGGTSAIIAISVINEVRQKISAEIISKNAHKKIRTTLFGRRTANV